MENLGLSKLITYQNTLFQANKAKLGLTYAYPGNQGARLLYVNTA